MKKINLFALMAMLFSISLFCACSSDDDETNDDGVAFGDDAFCCKRTGNSCRTGTSR